MPNYNICPGTEVPVIYTGTGAANVAMEKMRWGLIPKWAKAASTGYKMINAQAETVHKKPTFRGLFAGSAARYRQMVFMNGRSMKEERPL